MAKYQDEKEQLEQLEWLFQQKKLTEGLARFDAVLLQFPYSFHLKILKFKFLRELQRNDEALELLRQMHAMSGDNIMVLKELASLHFQLKQYPESLLYYKKLLFLDSFNGQAQERVKLLQEMLDAGVSDRLADTKADFHLDVALDHPASEMLLPPAPAAVLAFEAEPPQITLDGEDEAPVSPAMTVAPPGVEDPYFQTESAAELYLKQGLYREALAIYKNLFEKTGRTDHFLKTKTILLLQRTDRGHHVIKRLQKFLQLLQQRENQIV